jgi:hypothetical protein
MGTGAAEAEPIVNLKTAKALDLALPPHCLDEPTR